MLSFTGWLELNDLELANSSRVVTRLALAPPTDDTIFANPRSCGCRGLEVGFDDSWPGLRGFLGQPPYTPTSSPWYDGSADSIAFHGIWLMSADGLDTIGVSTSVDESICNGGVAGPSRDTSAKLSFSALLIACTARGAQFGLSWLECVLREAKQPVALRYLFAHPESGTAAGLARERLRVVLTSSAVIAERIALPTEAHTDSAAYRVEWELTALDPYSWRDPVAFPVTWDSTATESIEWVHAPCPDETCTLPPLISVTCPPQDLDLSPAPIPTCGGCLPVCDLQERVWELNLPAGCVSYAVSLSVTAGTETTAQFFWRPCGGDDCTILGRTQIAGLPAGRTVIADSVDNRTYGLNGVTRVPERGIIGTPAGAPWDAVILGPGCWELVAQARPGASYTVVVTTRGRNG